MTERRIARRCASCEATIPRRSARYCPVCGAHLASAAARDRGDAADEAAGAGPDRATRRLRIAAALGVVVAVAIVAAVGGGATSSLGGMEQDVDVPRADELAGQPGDGDRDDPTPDGCRPQGCERWSLEVGAGSAELVDGRILHHGSRQLSIIDADSGEVLAERDTDISGSMSGLLLPEPPHDDVVVIAGPERVEVREIADGSLRWEAELGESFERPILADDLLVATGPQDSVGGNGLAPRVRGLQLADGEERYARDGYVGFGQGLIVSLEDDQLALADRTSGEVVLTTAADRFRGASQDRVALVEDDELVIRSVPGGRELSRYPQPEGTTLEFADGLVVRHRPPTGGVVRADGGRASPLAGRTEVIDPVNGNVLAQLGPGATASSAPPLDGVAVLIDRGEGAVVTAYDRSWSQRWQTRLTFERHEGDFLAVAGAERAADSIAVYQVDDEGVQQLVPLDVATGLPSADVTHRDLGDSQVVVSSGDLTITRSRQESAVRGPAGIVWFPGSIDVLHPGDPLLVHHGTRLIAVDESLLRDD